MSDPANSVTSDSGRYYTWPADGDRQFISITTVQKNGVPKPALLPWATKQAAEYTLEHIDLIAALRERSRGV